MDKPRGNSKPTALPSTGRAGPVRYTEMSSPLVYVRSVEIDSSVESVQSSVPTWSLEA